MTTIVATLDAMAADQRVSVEGSPFYHADKIFRVGNSLFGTAGDGNMCLVMIEWLKTTQRSRLALYKLWGEYDRDQLWLLELRQEPRPKRPALYLWSGWGVPERLHETRYAIGSGAMAAIDAIDHGADLVEAVKRAAKYDQYSGAPIDIVPLKLKSRRK